ALHKLDRAAKWIDSKLTDRFDFFIEGIGARVAAAGILLLCISVPPLEFLPFAIAAIGLALLVHDGLLMIVALTLGCGSMIFALASFGGG
ncbi:MAG: exopolysaccharide biosynthesis protein, partial [Erythrobacter sp.]|nr:exopolysaccharide biosynthesis protein [Erythrobacter sp.]